eukprot:9791214-Lingulodinium_polyedra.AAC.1
MLQETHWDREALACWTSGVIPFAQVAASCAWQGPNDSRQAGVAIICPSPHRITRQREVIPGCA